MTNIVAVGGGSGLIGKALCKSLEKAGYTAVTITRNPQGKHNAISWVEVESNGLPRDTYAVINLAGTLVLNPFQRWNRDFESDIYNSRIGTNKLLRQSILSTTSPPKFWGSVSAIGYYPPHESTVYDETSLVRTDDYWSKLVADWENAAKLPEDSPTRHCNVRSGVVLSKDGGALGNMWLPFKLGLGGTIGSGKQWFPWIHIEDIVGIFMHALTNESVSGVLNGVAPKINTQEEFAKSFAAELHRPAFFPTPSFLMQLVFGSPRASMLLQGQNVYPKRTLESGYKYRFSTLPEALKDIVYT